MNYGPRWTLLGLTFLFSATTQAEAVIPLSLKAALERAVNGNADLRREQAQIAIADAGITKALGPFDLLLTGGFLHARKVIPLVCNPDEPGCVKDPGSGTQSSTTLDLGVARALETGGQLRLSGQANRLEAVPALASDATTAARTTFRGAMTLSFSHPLLRGFGREITEANLRKARIERSRAEKNRRLAACNVIRDVMTTYWELAYATYDVEIRRAALSLAKEQLRITLTMIDVGRLAASDRASVERAIAQREEDVAIAEQNQFYRSLDLSRLFGIAPQSNPTLFAAADRPQGSRIHVNPSADIARALEVNPQLASLRLGISLNETDLAIARNTLHPKLDFLASVGPVGRSKDGIGNALGRTFGMSDFDWSAGLSFEMPVQNRTAWGGIQAAQEMLELSRINATDFEAQLRDLVLRASSNITTTARRAEFGDRQVMFAKQNLEAEEARFQVGRTTNNDVLLRQQELKDAEIRLLRATVDQLVSEAALGAATADLLDRYGILLKGW